MTELAYIVVLRAKVEEAFAGHMEQPHTIRFVARMDDLISEPADVRPFKYHA